MKKVLIYTSYDDIRLRIRKKLEVEKKLVRKCYVLFLNG